ncbi:hypothetical protein VKS41_000281 [Umbelopsis sp. WA50703]
MPVNNTKSNLDVKDSTRSIAHDTAASMDSLNHQVEQYIRENESLRRENEHLRKEIERLRKGSQSVPTINSRTASASSSEGSQK